MRLPMEQEMPGLLQRGKVGVCNAVIILGSLWAGRVISRRAKSTCGSAAITARITARQHLTGRGRRQVGPVEAVIRRQTVDVDFPVHSRAA